MTPSLRDEIKQSKPFRTAAEEAMLNVTRTQRVVGDAADVVFKEHGVSAAQYNVLRILRGAGPDGLGRNEIRDRMIARMPDVTRLLERMEAAGLVRRGRDPNDRRCTPTHVTKKGLALLEEIDPPLTALSRRYFGALTDRELRTLSDLLTRVRQAGHAG